MRSLHVAVCLLVAAISGATLSGETPPDDGDSDPGEMGIRAGRLDYLLERATEASYQLTRSDHAGGCATRDWDASTKITALRLRLFESEMYAARLAGLNSSKQIKWPPWVFEPPGCPTVREIDRRIDWLEQQVVSATDPVCAKAAEKTGDTLICSVE